MAKQLSPQAESLFKDPYSQVFSGAPDWMQTLSKFILPNPLVPMPFGLTPTGPFFSFKVPGHILPEKPTKDLMLQLAHLMEGLKANVSTLAAKEGIRPPFGSPLVSSKRGFYSPVRSSIQEIRGAVHEPPTKTTGDPIITQSSITPRIMSSAQMESLLRRFQSLYSGARDVKYFAE